MEQETNSQSKINFVSTLVLINLVAESFIVNAGVEHEKLKKKYIKIWLIYFYFGN